VGWSNKGSENILEGKESWCDGRGGKPTWYVITTFVHVQSCLFFPPYFSLMTFVNTEVAVMRMIR
jgi:hypothetical protein